MKALLINTLLTISLFASAPLLAQEGPLKVGMSGQYFPFTFVEQDELKGFDKVSVTSGASTPTKLTSEVIRFLRDFDPEDPSTHDTRSALKDKNLFRS